MTVRTVTVRLRAQVSEYLAGTNRSEKATKDLRQEVGRLNSAGNAMSKGGILTALAGVPGFAGAAVAGLAAIPAFALTGAAAIGTLAVATNGVGDAMKAVGEGDAKKLNAAMAELSGNARTFVREYQKIRPTLAAMGDRTQDALFGQLLGNLDKLTGTYLPVLMHQAPRLAAELGRGGSALAAWSTAPGTVAKVNRQFDLAVGVTADLNRFLRAGLGLFLDFADAGRKFTGDTVEGLADGAEALERWVSHARATGQLNAIFENGSRILQRLGQFAGEAAELIADIADNPALVDGAEALFDILGVTLDVVHALLLAFESLPPGVQSAVVTIAVFGGATVILAGRVLALKAALDAMKLSALQAGANMKALGATLGGPVGVGLTIATVAIAGFAMAEAEARQRTDALADSLDRQTGAVTENTRAVIAAELHNRGLLKHFNELGIAADVVVDAILGDAAAMEQLNAALVVNQGEMKHIGPAYMAQGKSTKEVRDFLADYTGELNNAKEANKLQTEAVNGTNTAIGTQIARVQELGALLKAQNDPAFALIKAQKDLKKAQDEYNAAVKEFGDKSPEAKDASLKLAELAITLAGAVGDASEAFDGELSPALRATLTAANLTEQQIKDVEAAFRTAKTAGDKFAGNYEAKVKLPGIGLAISDLKKLVNLVSQAAGTHSVGIKVSGGTQLRRWGGIDYAMARGGAIEAHHAASPTVLYGERATGGEAFIPRNGDPARSLSILSTAAGWYGMQIGSRGGGSGSGAQTVVHEHRHTLVIEGTGVVSGIRREVRLNGGDVQKFFGGRLTTGG